jgi:hypothetical protein
MPGISFISAAGYHANPQQFAAQQGEDNVETER